jgi:hypothetical protein
LPKSQRVLIDYDLKQCQSEWEAITDGGPQGSILGPLLFLLYINDLPFAISEISDPVLYADDTSLIITNSDSQMFEKDLNAALLKLKKWFNSNLLLLNLEKTYFLQFLTKNKRVIGMHTQYENRQISNIHSTKFPGIVIDSKLSWHNHIDQLLP